jgi:AcrR family transcriptional regulator
VVGEKQGEHRAIEQRLSPGRHGLAPEQVREHQRRRILAATTRALVDVGYGSLTVGEITARAGVSRVTFYQQFDSKTEALVAAFEDAFVALRDSIVAACAARPRWPDTVIAGVRAATEFAVTQPDRATLLAGAATGLEPELLDCRREVRLKLSEMLRGARPDVGSSGVVDGRSLPSIAEETLVGGLTWVIAGELANGRGMQLPGLAPQLSEIVLIPYMGASQAARVCGRRVL